jgi:hypothetical protein
MFRITVRALLLIALVFAVMAPRVPAQELAKRLILKDGSYQSATKWEVNGDRVRYYSAEREEWEEVPNALVDWTATNQYEKDREAGKPAAEAVALDKELEAEKKAEELRSPQVAPGLHLPDDGGVVLLDTYQGSPELVELQQNGGEVNKNTKGNILRAAINPIASSKQTIELAGVHAKIQAHAVVPSIYLNVQQQDQDQDANPNAAEPKAEKRQKAQGAQEPGMPWDRYNLVRMQSKNGKRILGDIKIAVYGKTSQEAKYVPATSDQLTGGWVKITPSQPLEPGEYAVVETLGKEGMNLFVWDFGVNPAAPANTGVVTKPEPSAAKPDKPKDLNPRQ